MASIERQIEINDRLQVLDEILREASNVYVRATRDAIAEKEALIVERMKED